MSELHQMYLLIAFLVMGLMLGMLPEIIRKFKIRESNKAHIKSLRDQRHYVHESHILMVGFESATECINCRGTSNSSDELKKLILPCTMELSVYDGNRKFNNTGETNV